MITREQAIQELTQRWHQQCELFPLMRDEIPLVLYLQRNVPTLLRNRRMREKLQ